MDSLLKEKLHLLLRGMTEWRWKLYFVHEEAKIPRLKVHAFAEIVYFYILKLANINFEFKLLKKLHFGEDLDFSHEMFTSFLQDLQEFFVVPKLHQSYFKDNTNALKKHEILAVFIDFLLQLLYFKTEVFHPYEDRIDHLKKELRFLVTILGDASLLCYELEEVDILKDFQSAANEAGSFVYSVFFAMDGEHMATRMDALASLLRHIQHVRNDITGLSVLLPHISKTNITAKTSAANSVFIIDSLLHDLEDLMNLKRNLTVDVKAWIKVLHQQLMLSQSFLKDIEVPRHLEIEGIRGPVMQISNLAYEAEYLVNSFLVENVPHDYFTVRLPDIIHKIKLVGTELQEIKKSYNNSGVLKVARDLNAQLSLQTKRNVEVDDDPIGLEDATTDILDQLLGGANHRQIITIFGMPGLGKTTLAKKLYNHCSVNCHFDRRSWSVISQTYQKKNLLIGILINLGSELEKVKMLNMDEEGLGLNIHKILMGRRYLIIMDDVWDSSAWDDVQRYFPNNEDGSRILFTTRNKFDWTPPNSISYELRPLSDDWCWKLLRKRVFHDEPSPPPPQLQLIGEEIAKKCHGLPLAVVVIAGILSSVDKEENAWKKVGGSLASYIFSDQNNSTMNILKLSYTHLPDHLKPCFLYFGAFAEDTEIPVKKLKCLWIAERFINKEDTLKNADKVAEEYLRELIDRSLVMVTKRRSDGGAKACVVHDLLHDLCLRIAEEEKFLKLIDHNHSIYTKHLRLRINMKEDPCASYLDILPFGFHIRSLSCSRIGLLLNFQNMKLLEVLDLPRHILIRYDIEHQVQLKYLAINCLPASIGNFVNLEFLIVFDARDSSISISSVVQNLVKLKYLSVPNAYFGKNCSSYQKNNLEFLSNVVIGNKEEDEEMMKCSPHLCKLKCNFGRLVLDKHDEYRYPDLRFLIQLESLKVSNLRMGASMEINFPSNIKKLTLFALSLPCEKMSTIGGLPNLQFLKLHAGALVGESWHTRDGEFQQLKFLKLVHIKITHWNVASNEHFPRLEQLVLWHCRELEKIPSEIGEIATLQLIEVKSGRESMAESARKIQEDEEITVIITGTFRTTKRVGTESFGADQSLQANRNFEVDDKLVDLENEAAHILDQLLGGTKHLQIITILGMLILFCFLVDFQKVVEAINYLCGL